MVLYHFTSDDRLPAIRRDGLLPNCDARVGFVTFFQPVVWLTSRPDDTGWIKPGSDLRRLTVRLGPSKRLAPYLPWFRNAPLRFHGDDHEKRASPAEVLNENPQLVAAARDWYVYLGTIAPRRITFPTGRESA